jgi:hypothetical protein
MCILQIFRIRCYKPKAFVVLFFLTVFEIVLKPSQQYHQSLLKSFLKDVFVCELVYLNESFTEEVVAFVL